jgi:predicted transcriptional regulator
MFYVAPDQKGVNEHYSAALKAQNYREKGNFQSVAIINLAATWKPNFAIEKILKSKQEESPKTLYVKDRNSVLVNEWNLEDDASNILIFDKTGKLLFYKSGKMEKDDIKKSFEIIEANL